MSKKQLIKEDQRIMFLTKIQKIIRTINSIIITLFLTSCAVKEPKLNNDLKNDCIKLENKEFTFSESFYNDNAQKHYDAFLNSNHYIDIFFLETHYGYTTNQNFKRWYSHKNDNFHLLQDQKEAKVSKRYSDALKKQLARIGLTTLYINCFESSSVKHSYSVYVKIQGVDTFSFTSNTPVSSLDPSLSEHELRFLKTLNEAEHKVHN